MQLVAAHASLSCERWLLIGLLVSCRDKFKPLSECVAQGLRQGVDISQDDVEGEGELVHVGTDLWQFSWPFEYGHLDVQDGVLQHSTMVSNTLCLLETKKRSHSSSLTRELGLSSTTKMRNTFALRAARTAAITRSFPSRNSPLPSDTMSNSWAVSVDTGQTQILGHVLTRG